MAEFENEYHLAKFLLTKYADLINEKEQRTIGEIKDLVSGNDLTIQGLVEELKEKPYKFPENYLSSLKTVFDYVKKEIHYVDADIGLNYWLSPKELMESKVADDEDLAVFMCAVMKALGDTSAEVIIAELDSLKTHAFVISEIDRKFLLVDPSQDHTIDTYFGEKIEVLKKYSFQKQKINRFLYRFNFEKYEQFLE